MYKKTILTLALITLATKIFATESSCSNYSGDTKNICTAVSTTKTDFYNKYAMNVSNPTEDKRESSSSCDKLSGIEKDTCVTKNNLVSQHSLVKPALSNSGTTAPSLQQQSSSGVATEVTAPAQNGATPLTHELKQPAQQKQAQKPVQEQKQKPAQEQNVKPTKVNIFNN